MKTTEEYQASLRIIADYAFAFGTDALSDDQWNRFPLQLTEEEKRFFKHKCHEGFGEAQNRLIEEVTYYQELLKGAKEDLREARRARDKSTAEDVSKRIKILEQRLSTLSHVADGIAWQMVGGEIHIARRLFLKTANRKQLADSNIAHTRRVADQLNKNPDNFALISDLTGFVQIGDLLVSLNDKFAIIELKEGKVNEKIIDFMNGLRRTGKLIDMEEIEKNFEEGTIKQIQRMQRQTQRMENATEVINHDKGINPSDGRSISVLTPEIPIEKYYKELSELHNELKSKDWAYTLVDGCLHIGMYRNEFLLEGSLLIESLLKKKTENFILVDWLSITRNVSEPIFSKPLPADFIIDILVGKVKVIMGLDVDELIKIFNSEGIKTEWISEKETGRMNSKGDLQGLAVVRGKAIRFTLPNGKELCLGGGVLSKIFYDTIRPTNIARQYLSLLPPKDM